MGKASSFKLKPRKLFTLWKIPPELLSQAEQQQSSLARSVKCVFSRPASVQDETKKLIPLISN